MSFYGKFVGKFVLDFNIPYVYYEISNNTVTRTRKPKWNSSTTFSRIPPGLLHKTLEQTIIWLLIYLAKNFIIKFSTSCHFSHKNRNIAFAFKDIYSILISHTSISQALTIKDQNIWHCCNQKLEEQCKYRCYFGKRS